MTQGIPKLKVTKTRYMDGSPNGFNFHFGLEGKENLRLKFERGVPTLQFNIYNVIGDFKGKIVDHKPVPIQGLIA